MAGEAEGAGVAEQQAARHRHRHRHRLHHYLPDDLIRKILLALPPKSLLRFRSVCKAWDLICSDAALLREHHLRQPAQPLLLVHRRTAGDDIESRLLHYCLEAVDLSLRIASDEPPPLRTVVRFEDMGLNQGGRGFFNALDVRGSCDGLLLLSRFGAYFVCNPATRRWTPLPELPERVTIAGFYSYGPSASVAYRVLYLHNGLRKSGCYVLTVGSQQPRSIERCSSSASVRDVLPVGGAGQVPAGSSPPVLHHGSLYWPPHWLRDNILVFDTEAEEFRWMEPPMIVGEFSNFLFETEGRLALSCNGYEQNQWRVDLWIKQDYENNVWDRYRIEMPAAAIQVSGLLRNVTVVSREGDMLVEFLDMVLHCDKRGKLLQTYRPGAPFISFTRHLLKESLVPHAFLQARQGGGADEPPFFKGL